MDIVDSQLAEQEGVPKPNIAQSTLNTEENKIKVTEKEKIDANGKQMHNKKEENIGVAETHNEKANTPNETNEMSDTNTLTSQTESPTLPPPTATDNTSTTVNSDGNEKKLQNKEKENICTLEAQNKKAENPKETNEAHDKNFSESQTEVPSLPSLPTTTATTTPSTTLGIQETDVSKLVKGATVIIQGLKSSKAQKYNGEIAIIVDCVGPRYTVELIPSHNPLSVRPRNLLLVPMKPSPKTASCIHAVALSAQKKTTVAKSNNSSNNASENKAKSNEAKDLFFSKEKREKIILHMNKDHNDSLKAYLHYFNKMTEATAVKMTDVDSKGMTVNVTLKDGSQKEGVRINFISQLNDPADVRKMTVDMHKQAFKELGWKSDAQDHSIGSADHIQSDSSGSSKKDISLGVVGAAMESAPSECRRYSRKKIGLGLGVGFVAAALFWLKTSELVSTHNNDDGDD